MIYSITTTFVDNAGLLGVVALDDGQVVGEELAGDGSEIQRALNF